MNGKTGISSTPVGIDGSTQPGYTPTTPMIALDGSSAGAGAVGIKVSAGGSTVRGLVIHSFGSYGIYLQTLGGNTVVGNFIGTDPTGASALPNYSGVKVEGTTGDTIGGTSSNDRNLISGNTRDGILVNGGASGTLIQGNYIGTDINGVSALPNQDDGVDIEDSSGTTVGGTDSGAGNLISGNGGYGIEVYDAATPPTGVVIQGNQIGTDQTGTSGIPNTGYGIIFDGVTGATIGGTAAGEGNTIAFNGTDGIAVVNSSTGITISGNSIFRNISQGIDLGFDWITDNDSGDTDTGPNDLLNFPVITSAVDVGGTNSVIEGSLNSTPSTTFDLEFFAVTVCDFGGNGEGEIFLGSHQVTTDANGDISFTANLSAGIPANYFVTATSTNPAGSTSEFSECFSTGASSSGPVDATYVYDGDGVMVKSVVNGVVTYYAGSYQLEIDGTDTTERKYYSAAGMRIAMRTQVNGGVETLNWLLGDHLGSTSMTANANGEVLSIVRYSAFGEIRAQSGPTPTDYLYTGQRQEAELGLYYYVARWYDPAIGRFIQADTIVPNPASAISFDRYAYSYNSPLNYTDPSGHVAIGEDDDEICVPGSYCDPGPNGSGVPGVVLISCGKGDDNCATGPNGYKEGDEEILPDLATLLEDSGYIVLYTDWNQNNNSKDEQARQIRRLMDQYPELKIYLFGHSAGADANIVAVYDYLIEGNDPDRIGGFALLDSFSNTTELGDIHDYSNFVYESLGAERMLGISSNLAKNPAVELDFGTVLNQGGENGNRLTFNYLSHNNLATDLGVTFAILNYFNLEWQK